jgi:hypothetical protein
VKIVGPRADKKAAAESRPGVRAPMGP